MLSNHLIPFCSALSLLKILLIIDKDVFSLNIHILLFCRMKKYQEEWQNICRCQSYLFIISKALIDVYLTMCLPYSIWCLMQRGTYNNIQNSIFTKVLKFAYSELFLPLIDLNWPSYIQYYIKTQKSVFDNNCNSIYWILR